jgi:hypothetical protein
MCSYIFFTDTNTCKSSRNSTNEKYFFVRNEEFIVGHTKFVYYLTLILLTSTKWWTHAGASKWRMGYNSAFKGLNLVLCPVAWT